MAEGSATQLLAQVDRGVLGLVQDLFRTAARRVRTRIVNRCGQDVAVRYGTAEVSSLGSVIDRLQSQEGGAFARFHLTPGDVPGLVVIQGPLLFRLVGVLLGEDIPAMYRWRHLTQVDLRMAYRLCEDALNGITDASVMTPQPSAVIETLSANPRLPFDLPRSITVVEASLDFGPPDDPYGLMSVVLPGTASGILWPNGTRRRSGRDAGKGLLRVLPIPVEATAELARVKMNLHTMRALRVGSTIDLGNVADVKVRVGGRVVMQAEAGEREGVRCVRVKRRVGPST